jgi:hypothetical protein
MQQVQAQIALQDTLQKMRLEQLLAKQADQIFGDTAGTSKYVAIGYKQFDLDARVSFVRRLALTPEKDDKGKPKKRTKEELAVLKGKDKTAPGYEAKLSDLKIGQMVQAYFAKPEITKSKKAADETKPQAVVDKKAAADLPRLRMVLILLDETEAKKEVKGGTP